MQFLLPFWLRLRASFWFIPAVVVTASLAAALVLVRVDPWKTSVLVDWSPLLFGAGVDGSRAMLSAIATSMITVAGVVFSITIVALSLASGQYSPRVLPNFMRDHPTQLVLGVFLGIFAYCLVVLRTIRSGDQDDFIPSMAVLGGIGYALVGLAFLIFFIHHVAQSIQSSAILQRIASDTHAAIDRLFPEELGEPGGAQGEHPPEPTSWTQLPAPRSGYVTSISSQGVLDFACSRDRVVRLQVDVGDFIQAGAALAEISGIDEDARDAARQLGSCIVLSHQRTVEQDAAFGLQQLVDVAVRALSPGVNDPTTACMCIDQLGALLARLAARQMPHSHRVVDGRLRVIAPVPQFGPLLLAGFEPILHYSRGDLQVLARLVDTVRAVRAATPPQRQGAVDEVAHRIRLELNKVRPRRRAVTLLRRLRALPRQPDRPDPAS